MSELASKMRGLPNCLEDDGIVFHRAYCLTYSGDKLRLHEPNILHRLGPI